MRKTCERAMCDEVLPFVSFPSLVLFFSFLLGYGTQLSETAAWHYKTRESHPFCTIDLTSYNKNIVYNASCRTARTPARS